MPRSLRALMLWEVVTGYGWYALSAFATTLHAGRWERGALNRVLVIKTDHIGDFLLSLPAVRDFLAREPQASVGYVVSRENAPLAERVPWIDEVYAWDSPRYLRRGRPDPESSLRSIMKKEWDLILDLTNDRFSTIAAFGRPSRYRRDVGTFRLREKTRRLAGRGRGLKDTHATEVFYRALGMDVPDPVPPQALTLRDEDLEAASGLIARGWPGDRPVAMLHAGATWEFRRWPPVRFAEVARELERRGFSVFLTGGPNDRDVSQAVVEKAGLRPERNLAGEGDLPTAAALLTRADLLCANDGGLMHLAAAQGTPVVGIFGPTSPERFGPLGPHTTSLWERRDCAPCAQRHCIWNRARCLEPIEVGHVVEAALARAGAADPDR